MKVTYFNVEHKREHLHGVRMQILEALKDAMERIEEGRPRPGKHWPPNTWLYLNRWKKHCELALAQIEKEINDLYKELH